MATGGTWTHAMDATYTHARDSSHGEYAQDDAFDLPPLNAFPFGDAAPHESAQFEPFPTQFDHERDEFDGDKSVHSDEFMDAEAFMATHKPGEDSFLRETTIGDAPAAWSESDELFLEANGDESRRASDIFVPKSRNMEKVEFSSPKRSHQKSVSVHHQTPLKNKSCGSLSSGLPNGAFSTSNTAASSEFEIHVDNRLVLTPNSFKYLQSQQIERMAHGEFRLSRSKASSTGVPHESHSVNAQEVVEAQASVLAAASDTRDSRPSSAEKAMRAGPAVIKRALHEIEAMLHPPEFDEDPESDTDPALEKLKVRLRQFPPPLTFPDDSAARSRVDIGGEAEATTEEKPQQVEKPQLRSEGVQADFAQLHEAGVQTDSYRDQHSRESAVRASDETKATLDDQPADTEDDEMYRDRIWWQSVPKKDPPPGRPVSPKTPETVPKPNQDAAEIDSRDDSLDVKRVSVKDEKPARPTVPRRGTSFRTAALRQSLDLSSRKQTRPESENQLDDIPVRVAPPHQREPSALKKAAQAALDGRRGVSDAEANRPLPLATSLPTQMARRCRRFLCSVGERMSEQIVFTNGSNKVGRICVSTLPLSTGCQQFSVSPAVLELLPFSKSAFLVTFSAITPGVVAGIFQFRAVGVDCLYEPYEVLIEASVRGDLQLPASQEKLSKPPRAPVQKIKSSPKASRVTELPPQTLSSVEIAPTFLRFTASPRQNNNQDEEAMSRLFLRVTNTTEETQQVRAKCSHEHLQLTPSKASVNAGSAIEIEVIPLCRPFGRDRRGDDWCGTVSVSAGGVQREISVVIDRRCMALLPSFDELARVRQAISTQTDSFYFTKKVNRRGLYFHARAVECGSCIVGESHQVPVYICNGSEAPMTVFLQSLQDPFSCSYQPTTLQARKFIEVPIVFNPKAVGKVATCLVAYTVSGKAAVTLIARGVDKPVSSAIVTA